MQLNSSRVDSHSTPKQTQNSTFIFPWADKKVTDMMSTTEDDPPSFLLLLPPAAAPDRYASLTETYEDTLRQVLKEASSASEECAGAAVLEIALACPHLAARTGATRSSLYQQTQTLLAGLYKSICVIAAQDAINIEDSDGVDVRVLLVAWSSGQVSSIPQSPFGPVVTIEALAASQRPWQYAFAVESKEGEDFVRAFVEAKRGAGAYQSSPDSATREPMERQAHDHESHRHSHVAVGGTFDHIHIGHKLLLTMTLFAVDEQCGPNQDRSVTIGITGDELLKNKKYADYLESWQARQRYCYRFVKAPLDFTPPEGPEAVVEEVNEPGPNGHAVIVQFRSGLSIKFVEIWDPFGPTITDENISALVISAETRSGGKAVNDKRIEKGWPALQVFEVDVLDPEEASAAAERQEQNDFQSKLSSTEIRRKLSAKAAGSSL